MKKIDFKKLFISFSIVVIFVLVSLILTKGTMQVYEDLVKPVLAPPAILFPIVWSILYTILAITIYRFYDNKKVKTFLLLNLIINIIWPILFFRFNLYMISAVWLVLIIASLIKVLPDIFKEDKKFAYLNLPYLMWLFFALYLNIMIFLLNK